MKAIRLAFVLLLLLPCSCADMRYDVSKGIDSEITLFSDELGLPLGDVGPITLKSFLDGSDFGDMLMLVAKEDEEGYIVIEENKSIYNTLILFFNYFVADPSVPSDFDIPDSEEDPGYGAVALEAFGFKASPQTFTVTANNPLTEEISLSGDVSLLAYTDGATPAEILKEESFSHSAVPAGSEGTEIYSVDLPDQKVVYTSRTQNLKLHLPANMMEKDPEGGMGSFDLRYRYKSYISLANDYPDPLPVQLKDLSLPLGAYRLKEASLRADVLNEIPISLEIKDVKALVEQTDEEGNTTLVPSEDLDLETDLEILSGVYGTAMESPVEILIKAREGTIPDIAGLQLNLLVKAPTGEGDKRMKMDEAISFNNIRTTISGGITLQGK